MPQVGIGRGRDEVIEPVNERCPIIGMITTDDFWQRDREGGRTHESKSRRSSRRREGRVGGFIERSDFVNGSSVVCLTRARAWCVIKQCRNTSQLDYSIS